MKVLALAAAAAMAMGSDSRAVMRVGATVPEIARLETGGAPATVVIDERDLERGYVELAPLELSVRYTTTAGYELHVIPEGLAVTRFTIHGAEPEPVELSGSGGIVPRSTERAGLEELRLAIVMHLAPGVRPGVYERPLRIETEPMR